MERFLTKTRSRSNSVPGLRIDPQQQSPSKMAAAAQNATQGKEPRNQLQSQKETQCHANIAETVAKLSRPNIGTAVTQALQQELAGIKRMLRDHSKKLLEAEQRISTLGDDLSITQDNLTDMAQTNMELKEKLDDLENRSCRNNLCILCLLENYKPQSLLDLCQYAIPKALQMECTCKAERAHRL